MKTLNSITVIISACLIVTSVEATSAGIANQCITPVSYTGPGNPLSEAGLYLNDPRGSLTERQKSLMAGVMARINQLGAGELVRKVTVNVHEGGRPGHGCASRTDGSTIELTNGCGSVSGDGTVVHFTHEICHVVGHDKFAAYLSSVSQKCLITPYASVVGEGGPRGEEFGEVCKTFLLAPDELSSKCPQAYSFLASSVFAGNNPKNCSGVSGDGSMVASNNGNSGGNALPASYTGASLGAGGDGGIFQLASLILMNAAADQTEADQRRHQREVQYPRVIKNVEGAEAVREI